VLELKICVSTSIFFLQFLAENTLIDADTFLKYLPSQIAAACVCLARFSLIGQEPWVRKHICALT
jgi:hypothetical protein